MFAFGYSSSHARTQVSALSSSKLAAVPVGLRPPASEAAAAAALVVETPPWFVTGQAREQRVWYEGAERPNTGTAFGRPRFFRVEA